MVYVGTGAQFIMRSGTISGNAATGGYAGGVFIEGSATFTMEDGEISGNSNHGQNAGGVGVSAGAFYMNGGVIRKNYSSNHGGGVHIYSGSGVFIKTGGTLYGNDAGGDSNTAGVSGDAVFKTTGNRKRNNTAGPADNINSTNNTGI
ncbi:MAG: hypothetical protein LBK62_05145 [Treponema sp.]|nr:hypothetical protein [Treponema sp.]